MPQQSIKDCKIKGKKKKKRKKKQKEKERGVDMVSNHLY
jgi:hypothetical protein